MGEDVVAETFKVLVESLDNEQARRMINAPGPNNQTCLHIAAERIIHWQMHFATIKLLIKKEADILLRNENGNTAYDIAQKIALKKYSNRENKNIARYLRKKLKLAEKNIKNYQENNFQKRIFQIILISIVVVFTFLPFLSD